MCKSVIICPFKKYNICMWYPWTYPCFICIPFKHISKAIKKSWRATGFWSFEVSFVGQKNQMFMKIMYSKSCLSK